MGLLTYLKLVFPKNIIYSQHFRCSLSVSKLYSLKYFFSFLKFSILILIEGTYKKSSLFSLCLLLFFFLFSAAKIVYNIWRMIFNECCYAASVVGSLLSIFLILTNKWLHSNCPPQRIDCPPQSTGTSR